MTDQTPFRFQFFLPDARLMTEQEINSLPADKVRSGAASGKKGLWIEIPCADRACIDADGKLTIPTEQSEGKGTWLNVFCPEGACEIAESTDVP
jgi:hypothetical protein